MLRPFTTSKAHLIEVCEKFKVVSAATGMDRLQSLEYECKLPEGDFEASFPHGIVADLDHKAKGPRPGVGCPGLSVISLSGLSSLAPNSFCLQ